MNQLSALKRIKEINKRLKEIEEDGYQFPKLPKIAHQYSYQMPDYKKFYIGAFLEAFFEGSRSIDEIQALGFKKEYFEIMGNYFLSIYEYIDKKETYKNEYKELKLEKEKLEKELGLNG